MDTFTAETSQDGRQLTYFNVIKKFQLDATVCRHLFTAQSVLIRPRWKEVAVPAS